jgi:type II secretory pathway pseudopilin PulG
MFTMKSLLRHNKTKGFTLVEMMIIAPMLIIMIGTIVVSIVTLTGESLAEGSRSQLINDVQDALDRIEGDVRSSGSFLSTNNFTLTAPQGFDNGTQKFVSISDVGNDAIVLNAFFTTTNPASPDRSLIYLPNTPFACGDASIAQNQVMTMNIVYFVKDSTLWRRTVATSTYASKPCAGATIWQQPSCAESTMATNVSLCKAQDEKILEGVEPQNFTVVYYLSASDTVAALGTEDADPDLRQTAIDKTSTVQISLKGTKTTAGRDLEQTGTIRVTRAGSIVKYATPQP